MGRGSSVHGFPGLTPPVGVDGDLRSVYRGEVVDIADPQKRKRCRVRVNGIFPGTVPANRLPWAEVACMMSSSLAGDFFPIVKGDRVWVMFEDGDRNKPLITGLWIARPARLNDVPSDVAVDYDRTQGRWVRVDRVGNSITMSELPEEEFLRLASGSAQVTLDQKDGSITLRSASGQVRTEGNSAETEVEFYAVTSNQIIMSAGALGKLDSAAGILQLMSNFEASLHALDPVTGGGVVRVGGYLPRYKGVAVPAQPNMAFRQTPTVEVVARTVQLGSPTRVVEGVNVPETETTEVNGVEVLITAAPASFSPSGQTVKITVDAAGDITIESTTKVHVEAPEVEIETTNASIDASGEVEITATSKVTIEANEVEINGATAIRMT